MSAARPTSAHDHPESRAARGHHRAIAHRRRGMSAVRSASTSMAGRRASASRRATTLLIPARYARPHRREARLQRGRVRRLHGPARRPAWCSPASSWPRCARAARSPRSRGWSQGRPPWRAAAGVRRSGAVQCGFCVPGMILAATALLRENPHPSPDEIRAGLGGNLCRCSGYVKSARGGRRGRRERCRHERRARAPSESARPVSKSPARSPAARSYRGPVAAAMCSTARYFEPACPCAHPLVRRVRRRAPARRRRRAHRRRPAEPSVRHDDQGRDVLATDKVRYVGEAVARSPPWIARPRAVPLQLIEVEYEELPAVLDPDAALAPGAPLIHEDFARYVRLFDAPRPATCFGPGDRRRRRRFGLGAMRRHRRGRVFDAGAGPCLSRALRRARRGGRCRQGHGLVVASIDQSGPGDHRRVAWPADGADPRDHAAGRRRVRRQDGAYTSNRIAAALALETGRPVKLVLSRDEDFAMMRSRHPMRIRMRPARDPTERSSRARPRSSATAAPMPTTARRCWASPADGARPLSHPQLARRAAAPSTPTSCAPRAFRGFGNPQILRRRIADRRDRAKLWHRPDRAARSRTRCTRATARSAATIVSVLRPRGMSRKRARRVRLEPAPHAARRDRQAARHRHRVRRAYLRLAGQRRHRAPDRRRQRRRSPPARSISARARTPSWRRSARDAAGSTSTRSTSSQPDTDARPIIGARPAAA